MSAIEKLAKLMRHRSIEQGVILLPSNADELIKVVLKTLAEELSEEGLEAADNGFRKYVQKKNIPAAWNKDMLEAAITSYLTHLAGSDV